MRNSIETNNVHMWVSHDKLTVAMFADVVYTDDFKWGYKLELNKKIIYQLFNHKVTLCGVDIMRNMCL